MRPWSCKSRKIFILSLVDVLYIIDNILFCSLQTRKYHVQMKINDWSEVNTLMNFDSADVSDVEVLLPVDNRQALLMLLSVVCVACGMLCG